DHLFVERLLEGRTRPDQGGRATLGGSTDCSRDRSAQRNQADDQGRGYQPPQVASDALHRIQPPWEFAARTLRSEAGAAVASRWPNGKQCRNGWGKPAGFGAIFAVGTGVARAILARSWRRNGQIVNSPR